ncbi:MAG: helix-turn-helix domain-containing protein [Planctomycetota bacterium]
MSKEKIAELEKFHRTLRDKRQADRVKAVIALSRGWSSAQVAEILLFDEKTSRHYFEHYQQGGLQALLDDNYSGAEAKLDEHQMSELEGYLEALFYKNLKFVPNTQPIRNQTQTNLCKRCVFTKSHKSNYGSVNRRLNQITVLRGYPNNPLYPQGKPDACVVGEKTFSTCSKPRLASIFGLPPWPLRRTPNGGTFRSAS